MAPKAKTEITKPCVGSLNEEDVAPQVAEWGMMDALAKTEITKPCVGSLNEEDVAPQVAEWGMMDALAKRSSVKAYYYYFV